MMVLFQLMCIDFIETQPHLKQKKEMFWCDISNVDFQFIKSNFSSGEVTSGILDNVYQFEMEDKCQLGRYYLLKSIGGSNPKPVGSAYVQTCKQPWLYSNTDQKILGLIITHNKFPALGKVPKVGDSVLRLIRNYPNYAFQDDKVIIYRKGKLSLTIVKSDAGDISRIILGEFFPNFPMEKFRKEISKLIYIYT